MTQEKLDRINELAHLAKERELTAAEQEYIVGMLLFWMQREMTSPLPGSRR